MCCIVLAGVSTRTNNTYASLETCNLLIRPLTLWHLCSHLLCERNVENTCTRLSTENENLRIANELRMYPSAHHMYLLNRVNGAKRIVSFSFFSIFIFFPFNFHFFHRFTDTNCFTCYYLGENKELVKYTKEKHVVDCLT